MRCAILSSTSSETLLLAFPTHVTLEILPRTSLNYSISHDMVSLIELPGRDCILTKNTELSIRPDLNAKLVPAHIKPIIAARGLDIENFTPMTKDEMMARLD